MTNPKIIPNNFTTNVNSSYVMSQQSLEKIQSINLDTLIPTFFLFGAGLIYYLYKNYNIRNNLVSNNVIFNENANNNVQENVQNNANQNVNENLIQNNSNIPDDINTIKIYILINSEKKLFKVQNNLQIGNFIKNSIRPQLNQNEQNKVVYLICQGRRLEESKQFQEYLNITNDTVIHCFITQTIISAENIQNINNNNNNQNIITEDENAVSIYTIIVHLFIFLIFIVLIISYKVLQDILSTATLILLQFMIFIWVTQVSKSLAKLIIHKKISYN